MMCELCIRTCNAIGELTAEEGDSVNIFTLNYEIFGPSAAIDCNGEWTDYNDRRFDGDSLVECLESAVEERRIR